MAKSKVNLYLIFNFFLVGFITIMNDIASNQLKLFYNLMNWQAMLVQASFFFAYFVFSIPGGVILSKIDPRKYIVISYMLITLGALMFTFFVQIDADFYSFLLLFFILGLGITQLQVVINPLVVVMAPLRKQSFHLSLCAVANSIGCLIVMLLVGQIVLGGAEDGNSLKTLAKFYLFLAVVFIILIFSLKKIYVPPLNTENKHKSTFKDCLKNRRLILGSIAIFMYLGAEISIPPSLLLYISSMSEVKSAFTSSVVAYFFLFFLVGRIVCASIISFVKAEAVLFFNSVTIVILLLMAISDSFSEQFIEIPYLLIDISKVAFEIKYTSINYSVLAILPIGFFSSFMWSLIFPLSLANLKGGTAFGSGILCTMIVGGSLIPPIQGYVADLYGFISSFWISTICFIYIVIFSIYIMVTNRQDFCKKGPPASLCQS